MKKKINNYLNSIPYQLFSKINFFYETLISLEEFIWKNKIEEKKIDTFLYVCGYPRSGTTVIANFLNLSENFSAYTHRDMPLILSPILWSKFSNIYYKGFKEIKRKHGDLMTINMNYVDSFEETIWKNFENKKNFFEIYKKNVKKLVYLKKKSHFLSKSNQNLARIKLIIRNIPNSKFLIIYRNPLSQLKSLLKVNKIFFDEIEKNQHFLKELDFLGHYEFGPNRKFIFTDLKNINQIKIDWYKGNYALSYIQEWIDVHQMIFNDYSSYEKIKIVNYDKIKDNYKDQIIKISKFCKLNFDENNIQEYSKIFNFQSSSDSFKIDFDDSSILNKKITEAQVLYEKLLKISL